MTSRRQVLLSLLILSGVCLGVLPVWGQEEGADAAEAVASPTEETLTAALGWQYQSISGNERRFDQYVTPPAHLYLSELMLHRLDPTDGASFDLYLSNVGEPTSGYSAWLNGDGFTLDGAYRRSTFYQDFEPNSGRSRRRDYFAAIESDAAIGRNVFWGLGVREVDLLGNPARGREDFTDRNTTAAFGLRSGGYWFDLTHNREKFDVRTGDYFSGDTSSWGVAFSPSSGRHTQISGSFVRHQTDLDDFAGEVRSWNALLTVNRPVSSDLNLFGELRRSKIDRTITQNAYARAQTSGRIEAEYVLRPGTTVTGYWANANTDYVDGRQASVVDVASNVLGVGVKSRLSRALKVSGKFSRHDISDRPLYYHVDNSFGNSLVYSALKRLDLSATYAPAGPWGLTSLWQRRVWENDAQSIYNTLQTFGLTGWWQDRTGKLTLTGSFLRQDFDLPLRDITTLQGYDSRVSSVVFDATYALSDRTSLYASYADAWTTGAVSNEYERLSLGVSRDEKWGRVSAEVNLGSFDDDFSGDLNYDADLYRLEYQRQF